MINPAELAAKESLDRVYECITGRRSFVLEAGAGAGKTYTLIHSLKHIIKNEGPELIRKNQKVACITYTNVARDEIESRTDRHPAIFTATIHAFCWSIIKDFQTRLREKLQQLDKWSERLKEITDIKNYSIQYELGYPRVTNNQIMLGHNDVLSLTVCLLDDIKFRKLFLMRYPIILIDEYQDTDKLFVKSLKQHFLNKPDGPLIGFFGDHWQKIYNTGCGKIEHDDLEVIGKRANFRSSKAIIDGLNKMRPELPQEISDPLSIGSINIYHTNQWEGVRRTEGHWRDDLPSDVAHNYLEKTKAKLIISGWDFSPDKTKILMLTHNVLANEQGYQNLASVFSRNESYIKKENPYMAFFMDVLEPVCIAYENRKYGEMFSILEGNTPLIRSHSDKKNLASQMDKLLSYRKSESIDKVINHLLLTKYPLLPENIMKIENDLLNNYKDDFTEHQKEICEQTLKLKAVSYQEVIAVNKFIEEKTPFATKHGVKGAEFENVLVVFGRGWAMYNFSQMLEYALNDIPPEKLEFFERNRNLFYVAVSRPKKRLALLFTQKLSDPAIETLSTWFGKDSIEFL
ncbi:DNA helicase II [Paenibacillus sp. FSL R5-0345]|nr:DNA helicase II [Paenibacillus sp. FSL R5-0345]